MQPRLRFLDDELVDRIVNEAREVLAEVGVEVQHAGARELLLDHGASPGSGPDRVLIPDRLVDRALASVPGSFALFGAAGERTHDFRGDAVHFAPASSAILVLDPTTGAARPPTTADYVRYARVMCGLPGLAAQSTAFVPADVPQGVADAYRLFLSLLSCPKPVVTGAFSAAGFSLMHDLLVAVRGSAEALAERPLALFSCCPTSPLRWTADGAANLLDCSRAGVPVEIVPVPLSGFMAPVTLVGTLVQHAAEVLSGVVLGQLARPGAPMLFGGCPAIFDVRYESAPMGAAESMMLAAGAAEVGRSLGLPAQGYVGLSDAKSPDAQAGLETAMGATVAALGAFDNVSGPGMLDFITCHSTAKLVVDHEVCLMVQRLRRGIDPRDGDRTLPLIQELMSEGHLLIADHTRRHLRDEIAFPGPVIDRAARARWVAEGSTSLSERAAAEVERLAAAAPPCPVGDDVARELEARMLAAARAAGMERLPDRES